MMPQSLKQKRICSPKPLLSVMIPPVVRCRIPNVLRKNNLDTTQAAPKQQGQKSAEMPPALAAAVKNTRSAAENSRRSLFPLENRKVKDEIFPNRLCYLSPLCRALIQKSCDISTQYSFCPYMGGMRARSPPPSHAESAGY